MGERELREKYGGKLAKAINRAIRAELPEGNVALNRLAKLAGPASHGAPTTPEGKPNPAVVAYEKHKRLVAGMANQIRVKWGIPPESRDGDATPAKPRPNKPRTPKPNKFSKANKPGAPGTPDKAGRRGPEAGRRRQGA